MKGTRLMFFVHHHGPVTPQDLAKITGEDSQNISTNLQTAWEEGLLVRRTRHTDIKGTDPYEYLMAPYDDWEAVP